MFSIILAAFIATAGHGCPAFFAGARAPEAPAADAVICYDGYSLGHSAATRSPAWSAEHLVPAGALKALTAKRTGTFHRDPLIPAADQSKTTDFRCSRFDRGHATPVGDFGDPQLEADTFSMANMMVQDMSLNEGLWAGIEGSLLKQAAAGGEFFIVTGPMFGGNPSKLNGRVTIPSATWKAVYSPTERWAGAYLAANDDSGHWRPVSVAELTGLIGFDPLPAVPPDVKAAIGPLPQPTKGTTALPARTCASH